MGIDRRRLARLLEESQARDCASVNTTEEVIGWVERRNSAVEVQVERIPFRDLESWSFNRDSGFLEHDTGKFFSIRGVSVRTNWGKVPEWDQPIINQPEVGYLGILSKNIGGVLHFLLQAKVEPGNVNRVQLSPTLQATKSNYSRIHKGATPKYLDEFRNPDEKLLVFDQLQSEQGARFIGKRNRNLIVYTEEELELDSDFIWVTLRQIKELLRHDNLVNMDTRTVVAGVAPLLYDLSSAASDTRSLHRMGDLIAWITSQKCRFELEVTQKSLFDLRDWEVGDSDISHESGNYFKVLAANVKIENREVARWHQPLIQPIGQGLVAFIYKRIGGQIHFLVQSKLECGNFDIIELAPTVQCLTGSYAIGFGLPYLDYVLGVVDEQHIRYDTVLSEEGGRFYEEQNRHLIVEADDSFDEQEPPDYRWISLPQLYDFLRFNNYLNIQARSLLSAICKEWFDEDSL